MVKIHGGSSTSTIRSSPPSHCTLPSLQIFTNFTADKQNGFSMTRSRLSWQHKQESNSDDGIGGENQTLNSGGGLSDHKAITPLQMSPSAHSRVKPDSTVQSPSSSPLPTTTNDSPGRA